MVALYVRTWCQGLICNECHEVKCSIVPTSYGVCLTLVDRMVPSQEPGCGPFRLVQLVTIFFPQCFGSMQEICFPTFHYHTATASGYDGSCMLLKHWIDNSHLASVGEMLDTLELPSNSGISTILYCPTCSISQIRTVHLTILSLNGPLQCVQTCMDAQLCIQSYCIKLMCTNL